MWIQSRTHCLCLVFIALQTLTAHGQVGATLQGIIPKSAPVDVGIIFNMPNILMALEGYQAGLGAKLGLEKVDLRGMLDLTINASGGALAVETGVAAELHVTPEPLSFYWGGEASLGFMTQSGGTLRIPLSAGVIAGLEIFPFQFLSFFVEYSFMVSAIMASTSPGSTPTVDFLAETGMGNNAQIGVVFYFMRAANKK